MNQHPIVIAEEHSSLIGKYVIDITSNYRGYCTGLVYRFGGSIMISIQPLSSEGTSLPDSYSVDEYNVKVMDNPEFPHQENTFITPDPAALSIGLGTKIKDNFTNLIGYTTTASVFRNGCVYYEVALPMLDGKLQSNVNLNWQRLTVLSEPQILPPQPSSPERSKSPGGPSMKMTRPS